MSSHVHASRPPRAGAGRREVVDSHHLLRPATAAAAGRSATPGRPRQSPYASPRRGDQSPGRGVPPAPPGRVGQQGDAASPAHRSQSAPRPGRSASPFAAAHAAHRRSGTPPAPPTTAAIPPAPAGDSISSLRDALSDVAYAIAQRKHTISLLANKLHDLDAEAAAAQARAQPATSSSQGAHTPFPQEADAAIAALNAAADEEAGLLEEECRELELHVRCHQHMVRRLQAEHRFVLAESERATAHADALARKADGMQAVQAAAQQAVEACHAQAARSHAALEEQRRGWSAQLAAKQEDAQLVARQAEAACAARDTAQQHLTSLVKAKAAASAAAQPKSGAAAAGVKEAPAAEVDPLKVLRPFTASRDAQGIADALRAAQAQHARGMSLVRELEAQVSEQRETGARLQAELEVVAHVSTLSVADLSPAVAHEVARDAASAEADALRAEDEAAAAEAQAAWLAEGLCSWRDRLRTAAGTAAAAGGGGNEPHGGDVVGVLTVDGAQALVQAVERAAVAALAARQARSEAPPQAPRARRRHRRRSVDSDGFELDSDDSRAEEEADDGASDDGGAADEQAATQPQTPLMASIPLDGGQQEAVAVDIGRLWGVAGQPTGGGGGGPDTARSAAPDTSRTELVTRQALKQRGAAAAAQLRRMEAGEEADQQKHGGKQLRGRDHLARHRAAKYAASHRDGDGAVSATCALLSGKTPSADCLLHELLALRRDVDHTTAAIRGPASAAQKGHTAASSPASRSASPAAPQPPSQPLGRFGTAAAAARAGVKVVHVMRSDPTAAAGAASARGRAMTPDPMKRAPAARTAAAHAAPLSSSASRRPPSVPRSTPGARSSTPVATPPVSRRGSGSASGASPFPAARSSTPSRSRSASPMSSREASFGSATLRLRTK